MYIYKHTICGPFFATVCQYKCGMEIKKKLTNV